MKKEFGVASVWPNVSVLSFSEAEILKQLIADQQQQRKVVFVLTASTNYPFARAQLRLFSTSSLPRMCGLSPPSS